MDGHEGYEQAMALLKAHFGNKLGVIHLHKLRLLSGPETGDNINDFSKLANEIGCFQAVVKYYGDDSISAEDVMKSVMLK